MSRSMHNTGSYQLYAVYKTTSATGHGAVFTGGYGTAYSCYYSHSLQWVYIFAYIYRGFVNGCFGKHSQLFNVMAKPQPLRFLRLARAFRYCAKVICYGVIIPPVSLFKLTNQYFNHSVGRLGRLGRVVKSMLEQIFIPTKFSVRVKARSFGRKITVNQNFILCEKSKIKKPFSGINLKGADSNVNFKFMQCLLSQQVCRASRVRTCNYGFGDRGFSQLNYPPVYRCFIKAFKPGQDFQQRYLPIRMLIHNDTSNIQNPSLKSSVYENISGRKTGRKWSNLTTYNNVFTGGFMGCVYSPQLHFRNKSPVFTGLLLFINLKPGAKTGENFFNSKSTYTFVSHAQI
jgi:hypothetical protein